jgi:hypothetical protein
MEVYVKHIEYDKFGSVINNFFVTHKWVRKNEEKRKKRKPHDKGVAIAELIYCNPVEVTEDFYDYMKVIDEKEYTQLLYNDYLKII